MGMLDAIFAARVALSLAELAVLRPTTANAAAQTTNGGKWQWSATSTATIDGYTVVGTGTSGRWLRNFDGEAITPIAFGAVGDCVQVTNAATGTDDTAALQRFLDYVSTHNCRDVEWVGDYKISAKLTATWALTSTRRVNCNFRLFAASTWVDTNGAMVELTNAQYVHFAGRCELWGNTGTSSGSTWSTRNTGHGLYLVGCGRCKFDFLRFKNFRHWGVRILATGNGSMADLGHILAHDCGQWQLSGGGAQTTAFTVHSLAGSANSQNQRTVLTVTTMPPADHFDDNVDTYDNSLCVIDGKPYLIVDRDEANSRITVYPWITMTGTTLAVVGNAGTLSYITGGAVDLQGGDSNVVNINLIDAVRCGIALWSRAIYGAIVRRLVTQLCSVALAIGRNFDSSNLTTVVEGAYFEGNQFDIIQVTTDNLGAYIIGTYALALSKCHMIAWPMTNSGVREHTKFNGLQLLSREFGPLWWDNRVDEGVTVAPNITLYNYQGPLTLYGDAKSRDDPGPVYLGITLKRGESKVQTLYGLDTMWIVAHGTGSRGQPTGLYRFRCEVGFTVNGLDGSTASARGVEFSGFTHPPLFCCKLVGTNWIVTCLQLENPLVGSETHDPTNLVAGAVEAIQTMTVTGAAVGDFVDVSFSLDLQGAKLNAWVSAADTVSYQFTNPTAGALDLGSGTVRVRVRKGA